DEIILQFIWGSICHAVHERVQFAVTRLDLIEELIDLQVVRNVELKRRRSGQSFYKILRLLRETLILIGNCQRSPRRLQLLRNRPRNTTLVGNPKNDRHSTLHVDHQVLRETNKNNRATFTPETREEREQPKSTTKDTKYHEGNSGERTT